MKKILLITKIFLICTLVHGQKIENLALTPPMGWNSWNMYGCNINEDLIKNTADAMVESGLADVGYEYIVIDDCWAISRDEDGNIVADPDKFPSGIKALADYIHSRGLKFGIYSCAGDKTCNGRPGSRGHEFQDARTYAGWGVDYLKYDWCYHGKLNAEASFITMRDALYAAKRPVVFSICEWGANEPWLWAGDVGHLWRTSHDIKACSDCAKGENNLGWLNILELQVPFWRYAGPGHWNDPDMMEVGVVNLIGDMTYHENRSHFTMWCMLAAPLILGNDLSDMDEETLEILSNEDVIAINQDPIGKQAYRHLTNDGVDVWVKPLSGQRYAIAVLNKNRNESSYHFEWKWRGKCFFAPAGDLDEYKIYSVWDKKVAGTTEKPLEGKLEGREVILLIMTKE